MSFESDEKILQNMQKIYNQCHQDLAEVEKAQQQWQQLSATINRLSTFYHSDFWMRARTDPTIYELPTGENFCILSEDALFDLIQEHRLLAIKWLRQALEVIDPQD